MEHLSIPEGAKEERYQALLPQVEALLEGEADMIARMANMAAALHEAFHFWWTGFYRVVGDELVLGPFQGPIACTRIRRGRGVCGTAWERQETQVVPDVEQFPGHIACSSASRSLPTGGSSLCWTLTANTWPPLTTLTAAGWNGWRSA